MATKGSIEKNNRRRALVNSRMETRQKLKKELKNHSLSFEERLCLTHKLAEIPRNASKTRIRNRCLLSGRSRGFYRKFQLSRIALRELASSGLLPGVIKASW